MTRRCLPLLILLLAQSSGALARPTSAPRRLTHKALANGVVGLLRANRHPANLRARLDRTSRYLMRKVADTKTWKPNPKLRFKSFKSFEEYRAYADRCNKTCKSDFSNNTLALVDVDAGGKKQRLVVLDPGLTGLRAVGPRSDQGWMPMAPGMAV